ncbi:MAG: diguanylate cyclase domain-containing protein [Dehalococcoidia bacterium]
MLDRLRRACTPSPATDALEPLFGTWARRAALGVYLLAAGRFTWVNPYFEQTTGYTLADLRGRRALELVHPNDRDWVRTQAQAQLRGGAPTPYSYSYLTGMASKRWVLESVVPVRLAGGADVVGTWQDITDQKQAEAQLSYHALHDPLTGLANRTLFLERLGRALGRRARQSGQVAALYLDLDDFKGVNDRLGHHAGDALLVAMAARLSGTVRATDTVARLGGDEFTVLLDDLATPAAVRQCAAQLLAALREPYLIGGHAVAVTASVGVALSTPGAADPEGLLRAADVALYQAKAQGKDRLVVSGQRDRPWRPAVPVGNAVSVA